MNKTTPDSVDSATPEPDATVASPPAVPLNDVVLVMPQRIGDFTIVRILGEGGMGTVYLAEDRRLGRKAAIKTMKQTLASKPENRVRFVREARAAAAVEHDNIVPVWQIGEMADGSPFIAMPFLQGEMLEARLKREPIQNIGIVLKVAREVSEGLAAAHARGLIHRDIKPGNIWIEGEPDHAELARQVRRCKILDFGLARSAEFEDVQITANGTIVGTPTYMAPEQASGHKVDHRADLFSLGVLLYRMSTGKLPFTGSNTMAVLCSLATVTPPSALKRNPNLPPALSDLIDKLLSKDPAGRPRTAAEVATAVRGIIKELQARKSGPAIAVAIAAPVHHDHPTETLAPFTGLEPDQIIALKHAPAPQPQTKARRSRLPWLLVLALPALIPLIWWLTTVLLRVETPTGTLIVEINDPETEARIKDGKLILTGPDDKVRYTLSPSEHDQKIDAGPYKIRVEGADGLKLDTPEFTLKKGDQITVRVTAVPKAVVPKAVVKNFATDRAAAEWVLSIGGVVRLNGKGSDSEAIKLAASLPRESFELTWVELDKNKRVSDAELAALKDCKNVRHLNLNETNVSDLGLAHCRDFRNLTGLNLSGTQVSDAGLAYFKDCKLAYLNLGTAKVTDAGLAHFKECTSLKKLILNRTPVSDVGLAYFRECKSLDHISLYKVNATDAGVDHFKDLKKLTYLDLAKTKITAAKTEELHKALPRCRIEWDGGVIQPTASLDPDRAAAEWVLSIGGAVKVNGEYQLIKAATDLPQSFQLTGIDLSQNAQVSDDALAKFKDCKNLLYLELENTPVSDAGLAYFKDCKSLTYLSLTRTKVSDAGLAFFKDCTNLKELLLTRTQVSNAGLAYFKDCMRLTFLSLDDSPVSNAGLAYFNDCKDLRYLHLKKTKVTAAQIEELQKALPECKIEWDVGGITEPQASLDPARAAAEWILSIGGVVGVNGDYQGIKTATDLPKELFSLTRVDLGGNEKVSDANLGHLKDCKDLIYLNLSKTQVSDAGLVHFKDCKGLWDLSLGGTKVSDAGLAHFKDCKELGRLSLYGKQISDAGLANFKDCKRLQYLLLPAQTSDVGLANFKDCKNVKYLNLSGAMQVTDDGLIHFENCKDLTQLFLSRTKVTAAKIEELHKALPQCKIEWDGGVIQP